MQGERRPAPDQTRRFMARDQAIEELDVSKRNFGGLLEWNLSTSPVHSAILVTGVAGVGRTNLQIIANRFIRDADLGEHANSLTVSVLAGNYNKPVITANCSHAGSSCTDPGSLLGTGSLSSISDQETAVSTFVGTTSATFSPGVRVVRAGAFLPGQVQDSANWRRSRPSAARSSRSAARASATWSSSTMSS